MTNILGKRIFLLFLVSLLLNVCVAAQQQDYTYSAGTPTFSTTIPVENGVINISNGNLHLEFGLANHPQRGDLSLNERLVYDSKFWTIGHYSNYYWWPDNVSRSTQLAAGWRFVTGAETGTISQNYIAQYNGSYCTGDDGPEPQPGQTSNDYTDTYSYTWQDPSGTSHSFNTVWSIHHFPSACGGPDQTPETADGYATDGSGYTLHLEGSEGLAPRTFVIRNNHGDQVYPTVADRFGNYWSNDANGNLVDDRGQTPVIRTDSANQIDFAVLTANGTRAHYTVNTATIQINTAYNESPVNEWQGSLTVVSSIILPDGSSYAFGYDSGSDSGHYGEMTAMRVPAGGTVLFGWNNFFDSFKNQNRWLTSYQRGSDPATTFSPQVLSQCASSFQTGCQEQVTMHRPSGDEVQYQLTINNGAWNTTSKIFSGAVSNNNVLTTTTTDYNFSQACSAGCTGAQYVQKQKTVTTLADVGLSSATQYGFDSPETGKPSWMKQYDFFSGSLPSSPTVNTQYTYSGYDQTEERVLDGSNNTVAYTAWHYNTNATPTSGLAQHGTQNAGGPYLFEIDRWTGTDSLGTTYVHDDAGTVLSTTDQNGTVSYGHDGTDTFVTSTTFPTPASGVSLSTSQTPSPYTGELTQQNGFNSGEQTTTAYDNVGRIDHVTHPDGGTIKYEYFSPNDKGISSPPNGNTVSDLRTGLDSFGRQERIANYNGQQGSQAYYQQDTCYDANGRVQYTSFPYQGTGYNTPKTCSGTQYTYDALDRATQVQDSDGTTMIGYRGRATNVKDVNGVQKITQVDGLGRITAVCEVSSNTSLSGVRDCGLDIGATGFLTTYEYNLAGHQTVVHQDGEDRTFVTDALGRTTRTIEPERGETDYTYSYTAPGFKLYALDQKQINPLHRLTPLSSLNTTR